MSRRIYLDHAATTPLRSEAFEAMMPFLGLDGFGNPSSQYEEGRFTRHALDDARDIVAASLGGTFAEVTFTSGGTESDNSAILGTLFANRMRGDHLITTQFEHEAVLNTARFAETLGFRVTYLPVNSEGYVTLEDVTSAITENTILISVMHANNEVGTIQPIRQIADLAHSHNILVHSDCVQSFGQLSISVQDLGVDLASISSHKIYGPKGVGALYVRSGTAFEPWMHGGAQERGRRAGTENVVGVVGFAAAVKAMIAEENGSAARLTRLRDQFLLQLQENVPAIVVNGALSHRLPNNVNISIPGCDAETLLLALDMDGIAASSGPACSSGSVEPSHVLVAMGLAEDRVKSALRFTLGRSTAEDEIAQATESLADIVKRQMRRD